jgi:hypothetical protein
MVRPILFKKFEMEEIYLRVLIKAFILYKGKYELYRSLETGAQDFHMQCIEMFKMKLISKF